MKLGIITFHRALNYGAVLQAYALKEFLVKQGYNAEIIDYRNEYFETLYYSHKINLRDYEQFKNQFGLKQMLRRVIEILYIPKLRRKFLLFQKNLLGLCPSSNGIELRLISYLSKFDYLITGSDQVWNLRLTNRDINYFLKFENEERRISFAASIGGYPLEKENECIDLIKGFKALSVRENATKTILESQGVEKVKVHLDPVFLLTRQEWNKVAANKKSENYILLFEVGKSKELFDIAVDYAKKNKKKIYYLSTDPLRLCHLCIHNLYFEGPQDFLSWIQYADYVFTNSFHASAFSIIYNKYFFCYIPQKSHSNDRLLNLLEIFQLVDCSEVDKIGKIKMVVPPDIFTENTYWVRDYFINSVGEIK